LREIIIIILLLVFFSAFDAVALGLEATMEVSGLQETLITTEEAIIFSGDVEGADEVDINGTKIDLSDGRFSAGLILENGKNFVKVTARWGEKKIKWVSRVLRLAHFSDLKMKSHWAGETIIGLATIGVIEGYPDGAFDPEKSVSKGELATWLVRGRGVEPSRPREDPFYDVPKEHWRAPYIGEAANMGYMTGYSSYIFGIDKPLTRSEATVAADRAEGLHTTLPSLAHFRDVPLTDPSAAAIYRAYEAGLVVGVSKLEGIFQPNRDMKRAEAAFLVSRMEGVKNRFASLWDFKTGYDGSSACRVNTGPALFGGKADPYEIPRDGETPLIITVEVKDAQGLSDISQVLIDLRPVGGPANALMSDAGDGMYSLKFVVYEDVETGIKQLNVSAIDKGGWKASSLIELVVVKPW